MRIFIFASIVALLFLGFQNCSSNNGTPIMTAAASSPTGSGGSGSGGTGGGTGGGGGGGGSGGGTGYSGPDGVAVAIENWDGLGQVPFQGGTSIGSQVNWACYLPGSTFTMDLFAPPPAGTTLSTTIVAQFSVTISVIGQISVSDSYIAPGTYNMAPDGTYIPGCQIILGVSRCNLIPTPYPQYTITVDDSGSLTALNLNIYGGSCP
jgi:hypothetical protein